MQKTYLNEDGQELYLNDNGKRVAVLRFDGGVIGYIEEVRAHYKAMVKYKGIDHIKHVPYYGSALEYLRQVIGECNDR